MQQLTYLVKFMLSKVWAYRSVTIILLCLIIIAFYQSKLPSPTKNYTQRVQQEYMRNLTVTHFTETGVIKDQIHASHWAYIPLLKNSKLTDPKMLLIKPNGAIWVIQAKYATAWHTTINDHVSKLELEKNVIMERLQSSKFIPIIMKTEQVFYFPDDKFITTNKYVEMTKPGLFLTGIGLKGYLDRDTIKLLNKVKTNYEKTF